MEKKNLDPEIEPTDDEEEAQLPDLPEDGGMGPGPPPEEARLGAGRSVINEFAARAPERPGVYRMISAGGDVLYVGKAKNIRKRVLSYARATGQVTRIARMVAATVSIEFVTTATETEALLLEANLIKRLRPRFNVLLRDDKSFPYILITTGERPAQICKHRGARNREGDFFGPFAAVNAVNRTITALERAFLLRSCSDTVFDSRSRPCLLYQIKRCSGPCTSEISAADYEELVREAKAFLSGRSHAVREELAREMDQAAAALDFERAAVLRDRLAALSAVQARQDINPRDIEEADAFAVHQDGGFFSIEVFFFRAGQNWGNRAYFPRADRTLAPGEVLGAFLAQFYDDKPCPRLILLSEEAPDRELLAQALTIRTGRKVEIVVPRRGSKRDVVEHALANAREALGRKLAEAASQQRLLAALVGSFGLPRPPRRIEVYDNSHIQGSNAVGAMIVAGPEGLRKNQYRKFNIRSADIAPGDDFAMMREVLTRRFKRLMNESPRGRCAGGTDGTPSPGTGPAATPRRQPEDFGTARGLLPEGGAQPLLPPVDKDKEAAAPASDTPIEDEPAWPDLVIIDGGEGQLRAARDTLSALGIDDVMMVGIAKGPDRDAGRETFHMAGREPFRLPLRDPVLYFVQRLRDEAHRFAIGSHRQRRSRDIREGGLQEIPGIGPARKRSLLRHFGTLRAIERASIADLTQVAGINAETAKRIYDFFHESAG
ncbi:MAG: excinuclease ABC subunit UvrC [Bradyrhizobiaceae bacterium]|nr:excinuclease ABC subunit UvrC [Bradyrhizobiaceae bacterium]